MIIPAINAQSKEEFVRRINIVRNEADLVQIDEVDGIYARPKNFATPAVAASALRPGQIDVHCMVKNVRQSVERWLSVCPARIAFHIDAGEKTTQDLLGAIRAGGALAGIAASPDTALADVMKYIPNADFVLLVSVPPGRSGQEFDNRTPGRVHALRERYPNMPIGVDGGVDVPLVRPLLEAGASFLVVGSGIFSSSDPELALRTLQQEAGM